MLTMLNQLRLERDQFLDVGVNYETAIQHLQQHVESRKKSQQQLQEANEYAEALAHECQQLKELNNSLRLTKVKNTLTDLQDQFDVAQGLPKSEGEGKAKSRDQGPTKTEKSSKVPDPPVFLGTNDPDWDDWLSQMDNKLLVNRDWYPTTDASITYVLSRLGGKAVKHTMNHRLRGCANPYTNHVEILEELADIYEDSDRKNNMGRQYEALRMANSQTFIDFNAEFHRLGTALHTDDDTLLRHLYNKIRPGLQEAWDTVGDFPTVKAAKEYLRRLDNVQRARYAEKRASRQPAMSKPTTSTRSFTPRANPLPAMSAVTIKAEPAAREITCFKCGKTGHLRRDCPLPEPNAAGKKAFQEAKINAMNADEEDAIDEDNQDQIDDSSDSGKE